MKLFRPSIGIVVTLLTLFVLHGAPAEIPAYMTNDAFQVQNPNISGLYKVDSRMGLDLWAEVINTNFLRIASEEFVLFAKTDEPNVFTENQTIDTGETTDKLTLGDTDSDYWDIVRSDTGGLLFYWGDAPYFQIDTGGNLIAPSSADDSNPDYVLNVSLGDGRYPLLTNYTSHVNATNNPHSVTATQVGLGNVDNTADVDKPISTATQTALDLKVDLDSGAATNLTVAGALTFENSTEPFSITWGVGGLSINWMDSPYLSIDTGGNLIASYSFDDSNPWHLMNVGMGDARYPTLTNYNAHVASTNNPHSVTADQVGLGNVDNTADADKPISTATQAALDLKVATNHTGNVSIDGTVTIGDSARLAPLTNGVALEVLSGTNWVVMVEWTAD